MAVVQNLIQLCGSDVQFLDEVLSPDLMAFFREEPIGLMSYRPLVLEKKKEKKDKHKVFVSLSLLLTSMDRNTIYGKSLSSKEL